VTLAVERAQQELLLRLPCLLLLLLLVEHPQRPQQPKQQQLLRRVLLPLHFLVRLAQGPGQTARLLLQLLRPVVAEHLRLQLLLLLLPP
jgi:hypothetical protein